jgi:DNA polymerase-3 subunit gamma/tau
MSLYLKYRPTEWEDIVGNEQVVASLESIVNSKRKPHSFLFTGPSGTGKTTAARILMFSLGCDPQCLMEVDSADSNGVDFIRELKEGVNYLPQKGKVKGYILDECQKIGASGQSVLLKCLEEPPDFCLFALCTTNPEKLTNAIKTRCTSFNFSLLSELEIMILLKRVCKGEKKEMPKELLSKIAEKCGGSPRNALSILELFIEQPIEKLKDVDVASLVDSETQILDICRALIGGKSWKQISELLKGLKDQEPEAIRRSILGYCSACLLSGNTKAFLMGECFKENFYNTGWPGVVMAVFEAVESVK